MSLSQDLERVQQTVLPSDPSFQRIEQTALDFAINDARQYASEGSKDAFLLSMMCLLALPGNGHTRLIPNDAVSVLPLRFVSVGTAVQLAMAAPELPPTKGGLISVNGAPLHQIEIAADRFLAGTRQRKRVIWPILLAWPEALSHLGFPSKGEKTEYRIQDENGQVTHLKVEDGNRVLASTLYPRNEHGKADPAWKPSKFVEIVDWKNLGLSLSLPSFFDPGESELPNAIAGAVEELRTHVNSRLLIDVRGNTGGNFLQTMPLVNAICETSDRQVIVLVDKFTFSAAIVFVAILKNRLGGRLKLIGEEMGDGLAFFAEGGLLDLATSGAVVRYSSAFHDWQNGTTDRTTPPEIAKHVVPVGYLDLDQEWVEGLTASDACGVDYSRILKGLAW